jgi:uncharacterized membrane protein YphA (DoxX/SURF4 family)
MHTILWILQIVLAVAMLGAGLMKTMKSRAELQPKMAWVKDFTDQQVRLIGLAEIVGAVGLVVPAYTGILPILTPIAAAALTVLMVGAVAVHIKLKEGPMAVPGAVLAGIGAFVTIGRLVLVPLS